MSTSVTNEEKTGLLVVLMNFIKECSKLPQKMEVKLDSYSSLLPSLSVDTVEGGSKKGNIIGGYEAEIPFNLSIKLNKNDPEDRSEAIQVLNDIGTFFDEKTQSKELPELGEREVCNKIEMRGVPHLKQTQEETSSSIYQASYIIVYKHKSQIE